MSSRCPSCRSWKSPVPPNFLGPLPGDSRRGLSVKSLPLKRTRSQTLKEEEERKRLAQKRNQWREERRSAEKRRERKIKEEAQKLWVPREVSKEVPTEFETLTDLWYIESNMKEGDQDNFKMYTKYKDMLKKLLEEKTELETKAPAATVPGIQKPRENLPEAVGGQPSKDTEERLAPLAIKKVEKQQKVLQKIMLNRMMQLYVMYRSPWSLPNRVTDFFLISSHGRFPRLHETCDRMFFNNNAKLFFRLPPNVRLFFPTLGQGCLAISGSEAEKRLWKRLAAKKSTVFFEPLLEARKKDPLQTKEDRTIRTFLEETCLYTEGDLFPNFIIAFEEDNPLYDVFSIVDPGYEKVFLMRNGWSAGVETGKINSFLQFPLSKIVHFLNSQVDRPGGQLLDIVLSCCNVPFSCPSNMDLQTRVHRQWEVLMVEGKKKMERARQQHTSVTTRAKALRDNIFWQPPPDTSVIDYEKEKHALFEFEHPDWEPRPYKTHWDTKRERVFTKHNCVCAEPCKDGKCKVEPGLCFGHAEDEVEVCESDESTGSQQEEGAGRESPSPMDSSEG